MLDSSKTPVLPAVNEDAVAPVGAVGSLVSSLVDYASPSGQVDNVTDPEGDPLGIAITVSSGPALGPCFIQLTTETIGVRSALVA